MEFLNALKIKLKNSSDAGLKFLPKAFNKKTVSNVLSLFFIRGGNILVQLLLVPVSIKFISAPSYGLWLTVSAIVGWLNIMDIGLANGLRNTLTIAIVENRIDRAKKYISTSYAILVLIAVIAFSGLYFLVDRLNWHNFLDIPSDMTLGDFKKVLLIVISSFFLTFVLKPIASVAYATHRAYIEYLVLFVANFINLVVIWSLLHLLPEGNILLLAYCFCFSPIIVTLILTVVLFKTKFKEFAPSLKHVDFSCSRDFIALSGKFFIIQVAALVIMNSNIFLIAHYFGNEEVTQYNIAQRYFNIPFTVMSMVLVPFWNIFTEAYALKDGEWLRQMMNKLLSLAAILSAGCVIMFLISGFVYRIWIGNLVNVPFTLNLATCLYSIFLIFGSVYATCVNGTGKVKLHMIISIFSSTLHIPIAIIAIQYFGLKTPGLLLLSSFWIVAGIFLRHLQYLELIQFKENLNFWYR